MAKRKYKCKTTKYGISCTGSVALSCGHTISETFTARTEEAAVGVVSHYLDQRVPDHMKSCRG